MAKEIVARAITVQDAQGRNRITLEVDRGGEARLSFRDVQSRLRVLIRSTPRGDSLLSFNDASGNTRGQIGIGGGSGVELSLRDPDGALLILNSTKLAALRQAAVPLWELGARGDDPYFFAAGSTGAAVELGVLRNEPQIALKDKDAKTVWKAIPK